MLKGNEAMETRASHLLFSLNRWEKREWMLKKLESGTNLIVDRYAFSGVVYSHAQGAPLDWVKCPDQGLLRPDIVFQLDIGIDKIKERKDFGDEIYEKEEMQSKISKVFEVFHKYKYWQLINANKSKDEIHKEIVLNLEKLLDEYKANTNDQFKKNFYPDSIGEDLFMYPDI
jgi:dTMP kinase